MQSSLKSAPRVYPVIKDKMGEVSIGVGRFVNIDKLIGFGEFEEMEVFHSSTGITYRDLYPYLSKRIRKVECQLLTRT